MGERWLPLLAKVEIRKQHRHTGRANDAVGGCLLAVWPGQAALNRYHGHHILSNVTLPVIVPSGLSCPSPNPKQRSPSQPGKRRTKANGEGKGKGKVISLAGGRAGQVFLRAQSNLATNQKPQAAASKRASPSPVHGCTCTHRPKRPRTHVKEQSPRTLLRNLPSTFPSVSRAWSPPPARARCRCRRRGRSDAIGRRP